jgi:glycosyltransferase involved in cell wall biosynthesis
MKVLMTADTIGGVWTYALELVRALEPHGVEVVLATMGRRLDREQRREILRAVNVELLESDYALEWMPEPWQDVARAGQWLRSIEDRVQPDVIHLNGYAHGALDWRAPVMIVAHSCVLSWWRAVRHEPAPPEWNRYRAAVRQGIARAELVIAPTQAMLSAVAEHYAPPGLSRVIANGLDPRRWTGRPKAPFILAAGRVWDEAKNVASLDRAAAGLPWPVIVAGEQWHPDGTLASLGTAHAIGHIAPSELELLMGDAAIYALPARYEPFGLSTLEAALAGCALVLGDLPSLREIWGDAALYVAPDDDRGLHDLLRWLIANDARRTALGARARQRAEELGAAPMAERYVAAYRELTSRAEGARRAEEMAGCAS